MISMGGGLQQRALNEATALRRLGQLGITVPLVYGAYKAAVYREFIPEDKNKEVMWGIKKGDISDPQTKQQLDQLIGMAEKLDRFGYNALGFTNDTVFDPRQGKFVLIDPGFDLGSESGKITATSHRHLNGFFSHHTDYIDKRYNEMRQEAIASKSE
jgi:tRNA A-37 threonylcarbamoyl transferase component Bud32